MEPKTGKRLKIILDYAEKCVSGEIISGQKHIWACKRLLRDWERAQKDPAFPYCWDESHAERIVQWFKLLRHSKGALAGSPILLTDWQQFFLCQLYGWRRKDNGRRRFRYSFVEVGRKNAKSQMEAGVNLYEASVTASQNGEINECYTAGTKRDQSRIILNECKNMLRGSPLRKKFKITQNEIVHIKTGSFIKALCKEDGQKGDGTNPAALTLDEYHQHQSTEFYDLGLGANSKEPLLMIITTAGVDLNAPCYTQEYDYCSNILNPDVDIENEDYFVDILESDDPAKVEDRDEWRKANPIRMSYPEGVDKIEKDFKIAKNTPEKMVMFLTKVLNIWVQATENGYMDMEKWKRCQVKEIPFSLENAPVYVGFDLSAKIDLTSVSFVLPVQDGEIMKYVLYSHSFCPSWDKLREREMKDKAPYTAWAKMGYITVTNSEIVDQRQVIEYVRKICEEHKWEIQCLCFDPSHAAKLMLELSDEGFDVVEVYQSHKSLNECTEGFREQVYEQNVLYLYNPVLNFAMANAVVRRSNGLIKIDKDAAKKRIDPVDATLFGFKLAMYHTFPDYTNIDDWLNSKEW